MLKRGYKINCVSPFLIKKNNIYLAVDDVHSFVMFVVNKTLWYQTNQHMIT